MKFKFASVAAAMLAATSANAADLGRGAPAAVDYVKVCDAYGTGFFYIPGTETCLKIAGYVRSEIRTGDADLIYSGVYAGALGGDARSRNDLFTRARFSLDVDARTATEFGLLRSMANVYWTYDSGNTLSTALDLAFIQWGGLTAGRAQSFFDFWTGYTFNNLSTAVADSKINLLAYTFSFGNGITASLSLEDSSTAGSGRLGNADAPSGTAATAGTPPVPAFVAARLDGVRYGGVRAPDVVGNINIRQAWGAAQLMAAAHQVYSNNAAPNVGEGSEWGWAIGAGVTINLPMLGAGDVLSIQGAMSEGAMRFVRNDVMGATLLNAGIGADAVATPTGIELTEAWGVAAGLKHNFSPKYEMNLQGSYSEIDGFGANDVNITEASVDLRWKPAAGFYIGAELAYRDYDFSAATVAAHTASGFTLNDGNAWVATLRLNRAF